MKTVNFYKIVDYLRAGVQEIHIKPDEIRAERGAISIGNSGVEIWWLENARGDGKPGWRVQQSFVATNLLTGKQSHRTETIANFAPDALYDTARSALMTIINRYIDDALTSVDR